MVVVYIPINPENKYLEEKQKLYVDKLIGEGWDKLGNVELKDVFGTEIKVTVLRNDNIV